MEASPAIAVSFLGWIIMLVVGLIVWRLLNGHKGMAIVAGGCALVLGAGILLYFARHTTSTRVVLIPEATSTVLVTQNGVVTATEPDDAEPKPPWVGQPPQTINGGRIFTVTAGPHATEALCEKDLTLALRKGVDEFIENFIGEPGAARRVQLEMTYIRDRLVQDQYFETVQASFGPMKNLHAQVIVDRGTQDLIRQRYQDALVQARLGYAGGAFALVLVLLGTAYGYLRLDTASKGYYSGRLKLAATAVILTAAAATALVVRQADPAAQWPVGFPARESSLDL